jgi:hypothetical protein
LSDDKRADEAHEVADQGETMTSERTAHGETAAEKVLETYEPPVVIDEGSVANLTGTISCTTGVTGGWSPVGE